MLSFFFASALMLNPVDLIHRELGALPPSNLSERSRLLFFLGKYADSDEAKESAFKASLEAASKARERDPADPAAVLWWIAAKGEVVVRTEGKLAALPWIRKFETDLMELKRTAPGFNYHAADRVLGYLYHKVPPIISIGSKKKARAHLRAALEGAPDFPGNQLFLAEFLLDQGDEDEARRLALLVVEGKETPKYPLEQGEWIVSAKKIIAATEKRSYTIPFSMGKAK